MIISVITLSISVRVSLLVATLDDRYYKAEIVLHWNESANLLNLPLPRISSTSFTFPTRLSV